MGADAFLETGPPRDLSPASALDLLRETLAHVNPMKATFFLAATLLLGLAAPLATASDGIQVFVVVPETTGAPACKPTVVNGAGDWTFTIQGTVPDPVPPAIYPATWTLTSEYVRSGSRCVWNSDTCAIDVAGGYAQFTQTRTKSGYSPAFGHYRGINIVDGTLACAASSASASVLTSVGVHVDGRGSSRLSLGLV